MELTVREIAELVRGEVAGDGDAIIRGVAPFDDAGPDEITFAVTPDYKKRLVETKAGAVIVPLDISESEKVLVRVENPSLALAEVSTRFQEVERQVVGV
ncbi:MAG: UDP-3-O-(3-hydroxymyristoyl)glucosamine N-acyltransferase, partial [Deltaproteobacteria bacterium]|nr:UDP-3-O-(3-hydroxymyristoyl)glucosamine N-acyltransferase [Deltaproteobacteria bacterium]